MNQRIYPTSGAIAVALLVVLGCGGSTGPQPEPEPEAKADPGHVIDGHGFMRLSEAAGAQRMQTVKEQARTTAKPSTRNVNDLKKYLKYDPEARRQGDCGNCWLWSSTTLLEIEVNRFNGGKSNIQLSVQWGNSIGTELSNIPYYYSNFDGACCGGELSFMTKMYNAWGEIGIPLTNKNADWQDGHNSKCESIVDVYKISQDPAVDVGELSSLTIPSSAMFKDKDGKTPTMDEAIANIKGVIDEGHGVLFSMALPTTKSTNAFMSFWDDDSMDKLWDFTPYCGEKFVSADAMYHDLVIIGYDDTHEDDTSYWTILNSWGTNQTGDLKTNRVEANRPEGTFRLKMRGVDYDCKYPGKGGSTAAMQFQQLFAPHLDDSESK